MARNLIEKEFPAPFTAREFGLLALAYASGFRDGVIDNSDIRFREFLFDELSIDFPPAVTNPLLASAYKRLDIHSLGGFRRDR